MPPLAISGLETELLIALILSTIIGYIIGLERESRGKEAGISTHILVISGAALFSMLSVVVNPANPATIASSIVSGIGFLGAGLIFHNNDHVHNLTTAASLWFAAAIGMAIGFQLYVLAIISGVLCALAPRIRGIRKDQPLP